MIKDLEALASGGTENKGLTRTVYERQFRRTIRLSKSDSEPFAAQGKPVQLARTTQGKYYISNWKSQGKSNGERSIVPEFRPPVSSFVPSLGGEQPVTAAPRWRRRLIRGLNG